MMILYSNKIYDLTVYVFIRFLYHGQNVTEGLIFKRSKVGLNSEFSFSLTGCQTKAKERSLSSYFSKAGE